jgi:hypothetical protein
MVYVNEFIVVIPFCLQGSEKRLCHGIVPTVAFSAHTLNEAETTDCSPEIITCILYAPVRMPVLTKSDRELSK